MDACVGALAAARPEPVHETPAERLEHMTAEQRMEWAAERLPAPFMLSSSFGAQAAVSLFRL